VPPIYAGLGVKVPFQADIHSGDTFTHIIDDPLILTAAASVSSAIRLGWSVGEALLFVGGLLEE